MRRYWISKEYFVDNSVLIKGEEFHHICDVCRQTQGHQFEVLNGDGSAYLVELTKINKKDAVAEIKSSRIIPPIPKPYIYLCVSLPKFTTFELILEKAVELGVKEVVPFVSQYSFIRSENSEKLGGKQERWLRIIKSATQQSGRAEILNLNPINSLNKLLETFNRTNNAAGLFPYEGESTLKMKTSVTEVMRKSPDSIWVFVGSEGGFSSEEVEVFKSHGLLPSTLGDQVLRVETACLSMLSILKYEIESQ